MRKNERVMCQWKPMCIRIDVNHDPKCEKCPLDETEVKTIERIVMKWAEENPEPVYPTWAEWLMEHGLLYASNSAYMKRWYVINQSGIEKPIPADIAEKLGIEPKER